LSEIQATTHLDGNEAAKRTVGQASPDETIQTLAGIAIHPASGEA
jgi:hypothetical protein